MKVSLLIPVVLIGIFTYALFQMGTSGLILFAMLISVIYFSMLVIGYLTYEEDDRKHYPPVSIIVPAYNEENNIAETIEGLLSIDYPEFEIIVVDDGSKDRTYEIAKRYEGEKVRVFTKPNGGKATAVNLGLKHAKYDYVAIMDADSVPAKNALKELVSKFDENTGAVTPALLVYKPKNIVQRFQWAEYLLAEIIRRVYDVIDAQYVTPGPFSVYKREVFEKLGNFNTKSIVEDLEMALRIQRAGYRIKHAKKGVSYTKTPDTIKSLINQRIRWNLGATDHLFSVENLKTGNLGAIVIPITLLGIGLTYLFFVKIVFDTLSSLVSTLFSVTGGGIQAVPFLIENFLQNPWIIAELFSPEKFLVRLLDLTPIGIISIIITLSSVFFIVRAAKEYNEPIYWDGIFTLIFFYFLFAVIVWLYVAYLRIFGGEVRFGGVVWKGGLLRKLTGSS